MANVEVLEHLEARAQGYAFLSALFLDVMSASFLETLRDAPIQLEGYFGAFLEELRAPDADLEQLRIDTAAEYNKLLLNMSASPVFPYESPYLSDTHLMRQEALDQVTALMRRAGFKPVDTLDFPADHIGVELEFMGKLCLQEKEAHEAGDMAGALDAHLLQEKMLREHLLVWTKQFLDDFAARAKSDAYRGLIEMTDGHLGAEAEEFGLPWPPERILETPHAPDLRRAHYA